MTKTKTAMLFATVLLCSVGASQAHASQCIEPSFKGTWVVSGTAPTYPAQQSYALGQITVSADCVAAPEVECRPEGGETVCSQTSGVKQILKVSVGETYGSFTGPAETYFGQPLALTEGGEGWLYADTTTGGANPTRVWFRVEGGSLAVVFQVTAYGTPYTNWQTFVRPVRVFKFPKFPIGL